MHDLVLHPASKALHYAIQIFEGMKAYRGFDGKIRLFRPEMNIDRYESKLWSVSWLYFSVFIYFINNNDNVNVFRI